MQQPRRNLLLVFIAVLVVGIVVVQHYVDPAHKAMVRKLGAVPGGQTGELMVQLPGQFIVASFTGFREVIAGALWVRADTFFHSGNFPAIIPIVRLVTWLDPHNIDVYTTGAWHLDYNFVDQGQQSDKRYIPAAVALLKEGIKNNPDIWDLYFELGWTHYNKKIMDFDNAVYYLEEACKRDGVDANTGRKIPRNDFVDNMLAHTYAKVGRFDDAIRVWQTSRARVRKLLRKKHKDIFVDRTSLTVIERNLALLYLRLAWRYGNMDYYRKGLELAWGGKDRKNPIYDRWAVQGAQDDYDRRLAANNPPRDALKPLPTNFQVSWKRVAPKQFIIKGKINLVQSSEYKDLASEGFTHFYQDEVLKPVTGQPKLWRDGSRIFWRLQDYDYVMPDQEVFDWKIDTNVTIQGGSPSEGIYISNGEFSQLIDLSNPMDKEMYPFKAKKYRLTIWWSPMDPTPDYIQDRIGWRGDCIVERPEFLDTKTRPGFRMIKTEYVIDRRELL